MSLLTSFNVAVTVPLYHPFEPLVPDKLIVQLGFVTVMVFVAVSVDVIPVFDVAVHVIVFSPVPKFFVLVTTVSPTLHTVLPPLSP